MKRPDPMGRMNAALDQLSGAGSHLVGAGVLWTRVTITSRPDALSPSVIRCAGWHDASRPSESNY